MVKKRINLTEAEVKFILDNYNEMTISEVAESLGRQHCTIRNYCISHNIPIKKGRNYLTAEEIVEQVKFILDKNPEFNPKDCKEFKINFTRMGEPALNWDNVKKSIVAAFSLIESLGFNDKTFRAKNAAIPIIYYIYHKNLLLFQIVPS